MGDRDNGRSAVRNFGASYIFIPFVLAVTGLVSQPVLAETKHDRQFQAIMTDTQGIESEIKNVIFYWEEKISETAFVPHELRHLPVKSGNSTVSVKFESIRQVDLAPDADKGLPAVTITLTNGKSKDFTLAIDGKFKGESDFGEVELPAPGLRKVVFK